MESKDRPEDFYPVNANPINVEDKQMKDDLKVVWYNLDCHVITNKRLCHFDTQLCKCG